MKIVDLFCGCGGLSLGFQEADFEIVSAFDNWDAAIDTYKVNFNHPVFKQDLSNIEDSISKIKPYAPQMIIGGPPCQDFSSAGKRDENNGRGDLTISFANIVSSIRPEWFVMENVARIVKTDKLIEAKKIFKKANYGLTEIVLDASLCGVPQERKRFILVGQQNKEDNFILSQLKSHQSIKKMTMRDYFGNSLGFEFYYRHPRSYARRGVFSIDEPSPTIRGVNRPIPKGYTLHSNDPVSSLDGIRPLSTQERSKVQTFPDDFKWVGNKTNVEQMIGNAVPVRLGYYIADTIKQYMGKTGDYAFETSF